jgi:hypothetical protein
MVGDSFPCFLWQCLLLLGKVRAILGITFFKGGGIVLPCCTFVRIFILIATIVILTIVALRFLLAACVLCSLQLANYIRFQQIM